jgi:hypothetical protein
VGVHRRTPGRRDARAIGPTPGGQLRALGAERRLLFANLCHRFVEDTDWDYSEFAQYDLGQAVAHVTVQARALGLHVRQFRAFDRAGIASEFAVPAHWEVTSMSAVGRVPKPIEPEAVDPSMAPERRRRPLDDLLWREDSIAEPS